MASQIAPAQTSVGGNWLQFARALIFDLAVPDTPDNEAAFLTWFNAEQPPNGPNAPFNPLNVQDSAWPLNASGQSIYPDWSTGVHSTANVIRQPNMSGILTALELGNNAPAVLTAIQDSPWAGGHYGGQLPGELSSTLSNWDTLANGIVAGQSATNQQILTDPGGVGGLISGNNPVSGVAHALTGWTDAIVKVGGYAVSALKFLTDPHSWVRIGMVLGGVALIAVAYGIINKDTIGAAVKGAAEAAVIA